MKSIIIISFSRLLLGLAIADEAATQNQHGLGTKQLGDEEVDQLMERKTKASYELAQTRNKPKWDPDRESRTRSFTDRFGNKDFSFIRIEHTGAGWNDGMDQSGADENFLKEFAKRTGMNTKKRGESITVNSIEKYTDIDLPPFVYITGTASMEALTDEHIKILRNYCMRGGMLIVDVGNNLFKESSLKMIQKMFPEKKIISIAKDDDIYGVPYSLSDKDFFPKGDIEERPKGIMHDGRWCVFYANNLNEAWKNQEFANFTPEERELYIYLGVNLVYYSLNTKFEKQNKAQIATPQKPSD